MEPIRNPKTGSGGIGMFTRSGPLKRKMRVISSQFLLRRLFKDLWELWAIVRVVFFRPFPAFSITLFQRQESGVTANKPADDVSRTSVTGKFEAEVCQVGCVCENNSEEKTPEDPQERFEEDVEQDGVLDEDQDSGQGFGQSWNPDSSQGFVQDSVQYREKDGDGDPSQYRHERLSQRPGQVLAQDQPQVFQDGAVKSSTKRRKKLLHASWSVFQFLSGVLDTFLSCPRPLRASLRSEMRCYPFEFGR